MQRISVEAHSAAAPEEVWTLLVTTSSWPSWSAFDAAELERPGEPEPEGVGAIRRFRTGSRTTRERVVAFDPPARFSYELLSGLPIRDYRADVTVHPSDEGGTLIRWESGFRGKFPVPGALVRKRLEQFVRETANALARAAEIRPPA